MKVTHKIMTFLSVAICAFLAMVALANCAEVSKKTVYEDFSGYPSGSDGYPVWTPFSDSWVIEGDEYSQEATNWDRGTSWNVFLDSSYTFEVKVRYISGFMGAGVFFNMQERTSKKNSQMVRFDGSKELQWGWFDSNGDYQYMGSAETPEKIDDGAWHTLTVMVDKEKNKFSILVDEKLIKEDLDLTYKDGYLGLQCSMGHVHFKEAKVSATQEIQIIKEPAERPALDIGTFRLSGVVTDKKGRIIAVCKTLNKVQFFSLEGKLLAEFGERGNDLGELLYPGGVTTDSKSRIIVADSGNNRIQVFDSEGKPIYAFGAYGDSPGNFHAPYGVAVDSQDNIIVSDTYNHRVQVFDSQGNFKGVIGKKGSNPGEFDEPHGLAVDKEGRIIVADTKNGRVQVLELDKNTYQVTEAKIIPGCYEPRGVALYGKNQVLVADTGTNSMKVFELTGKLVRQFTGSSVGWLKQPWAVAIGPEDKIIIADTENSRIVVTNRNLLDPIPEVTVSRDSAIIKWETESPCRGKVDYGLTADYDLSQKEETAKKKHEIKLSHLTPSTKYHFRIQPTLKTIPPKDYSKDYTFTTLPPKGMMQYVQLPVLVVIYTPINYLDKPEGDTLPPGVPERLTEEDIQKIKGHIAKVREFYWRNSRAKLDLQFDFLLLDKKPGDPAEDIERGLALQGKKPTDYAGVIFLQDWDDYIDPEKSKEMYRGQALGGGTYGVDGPWKYKKICYSFIGCNRGSDVTWVVVHEFHHQLDSMFDDSGYPEYPFNHPDPKELVGVFGEHYDCNAFILRNWPVNKWFGLNRGKIVVAKDSVGDGLPDDADVPINHRNFGSHKAPKQKGWNDMRKMMACNGVVEGLNEVWAGRDKPPDGSDRYPLYWANPKRHKKTPKINGKIEPKEWDLFYAIEDKDIKAKAYMNWDEEFLYFAFELSRPASVHIDLDAANNGWFLGSDNYRIALEPKEETDTPQVSVEIFDWDKFPKEYVYWNKEKVKPSDLVAKNSRIANTWQIELAIPKNAKTGLLLRPGDIINTKIGFDWPENRRGLITMFEPHTLFSCQLVK